MEVSQEVDEISLKRKRHNTDERRTPEKVHTTELAYRSASVGRKSKCTTIRDAKKTYQKLTFDKTEDRARTPSGKAFSPKVEKFKNFFQLGPINELKQHSCVGLNDHDQSQQRQTLMSLNTLPLTLAALSGSVKHADANHSSVKSGSDGLSTEVAPTKTTQLANQIKSGSVKSKLNRGVDASQPLITSFKVQDQHQPTVLLTPAAATTSISRMTEMPQPQNGGEEMEVLDAERNQQPVLNMPNSMDLKTVITMFNDLKCKFTGVEEQIKKINDQQKVAITSVAAEQKEINTSIQGLQDEVRMYKVKTEILTGSVDRLTQVVKELQTKMEMIEIGKAKRMMILSGFFASKNKAICIEQLYGFFRQEMCCNPSIEDVSFMGDFTPCNLIITFQTVEQKKEIFQNIFRVKDLVNQAKKKYIFKDYYTPSSFEQQKREWQIMHRNNDRDAVNQDDIDYNDRRKLLINGSPYEKAVQVPDPTKILRMAEQELTEVLNIKVHMAEGPRINGNTFLAYSAFVKSAAEVQNAYMNIKLSNAGARHVVCAWNIPGANRHVCEDYQDDDEHSAGQALLDLLIKNGITHRAIFVARYVGDKLNRMRLLQYAKAAQAVVHISMLNPLCNKAQQIADHTMPDASDSLQTNNLAPTYAGKVKSAVTNKDNKSWNKKLYRGKARGRGSSNHQQRPPYAAPPPTRQYIPRSENDIKADRDRRKLDNQRLRGHATKFQFAAPGQLTFPPDQAPSRNVERNKLHLRNPARRMDQRD